MSRSSRAAAIAVAGLLTVVLAACSIPSGGPPIAVGPPPARVLAGSGGAVPLPSPATTLWQNAAEFIDDGYLTAVAGQITRARQQSAVKTFLVDTATWTQPSSTTVTVVRKLTSSSTTIPGGFMVVQTMQVVGSFDPTSGALSPPTSPTTTTLSFKISTQGSWKLTDVPGGLYVTDEALHSATFTPHIVYFWNASGKNLIPDVRYYPTVDSPTQLATSVVNAVLAGPPAWMGSAAAKMVPGLAIADSSVPLGPDTFIVNLSGSARPLELDDREDLLVQIRWSLGDLHPIRTPSYPAAAVKLTIPNETPLTDSGNAYMVRNQMYENRLFSPPAFAIDGGKARALDTGTIADTSILKSPKNTSVQYAAVRPGQSDNIVDAAYVRNEGGKLALWVQYGAKPAVRVLPTAAAFLRPDWLSVPTDPRTPATAALAFVADGQFYIARPNGSVVAVPGTSTIGAITAFSVGSDGHQVALVANHTLYTAVLEADSPQPSLSIRAAVSLAPVLDSVTAVAWSAVDQLIVGGSEGGSNAAVVEVYVDGSDPVRLRAIADAPPTQIVSYPPSPTVTNLSSQYVMMQGTETVAACSGRARCDPLVWSPAVADKLPPLNPFYPD